jgi:Fe/S biogenesis protein NfuA
MTENDVDGGPVLRVSDAARQIVLDARNGEPGGENLALWIEVSGSNGRAYTYDMYFQAVSDARREDWSADHDGLTLVVPAESVTALRGSLLDAGDDGMFIENPNPPPEPLQTTPFMAGPPADLSGDVAQRVLQVLEQQINPSIAAHGGRADLVAVEDTAAYLRLSGGCAGCGMAAVTLSQGIEVAIRDSVPEITRVVDVTDHAAGTNPYFEPAKK